MTGIRVEAAVIRLHGVWCGRCGHPGHHHNTRTGLTWHVDKSVPPCQTKPPTPMPEETRDAQL